MYKVRYTYIDPSRAGPFKGSTETDTPFIKGDDGMTKDAYNGPGSGTQQRDRFGNVTYAAPKKEKPLGLTAEQIEKSRRADLAIAKYKAEKAAREQYAKDLEEREEGGKPVPVRPHLEHIE